MGRKRTPKKVLQLKGSWRGKDAPDDAIETPGEPEKPAWMTEKAAELWPGYVDRLTTMGVLTTADGDALALLCETVVDFDIARTVARSGGVIRENSRGDLVVNPAQRVMGQHADRMNKLLREFGLTPSARAGVTRVEASVDKTGKAQYLDNA